jgi:ATP-dependent DNA ligase
MSFQEAHANILKLELTPSKNDKIELLKEMMEDSFFVKVLQYSLGQDRHFNVQKLERIDTDFGSTDTDMFEFLDQLVSQRGANNEDKHMLAKLASFDADRFAVVKRIVKKNLSCGVQAKTVNKAMPDTIHLQPYMRCTSYSTKALERINNPSTVEEKADGMYFDIVTSRGDVSYTTRNGKEVNLHGGLSHSFIRLAQEQELVYMGEGLVRDGRGGVLDRQTGNGIITKILKGGGTPKEVASVVMRLWDVIPLCDYRKRICKVPRYKRLKKLKHSLIHYKPKNLKLVKHQRVSSISEAITFYKRIREAGGEGAILKDDNGIWKDHTSPWQVKIKNEADCELRIIKWYYGDPDKKYGKLLGGFCCESDDRKIRVNVGGGFSDKQRREYMTDDVHGKICTVRFEGIISDKNRPGWDSLFLPRFIEIREDKDEADTSEYIRDLLQ